MLHQRIGIFVALPIRSLDKLCAPMPVYHFLLKPPWKPPLVDRDGEELPDDAAAYEHAVEVARACVVTLPL